MKTLLERLKPEYLEMLDNEAIEYPMPIDSLKNNLSKVYFITDVNYFTGRDLYDVCKMPFDSISLFNFFTL